MKKESVLQLVENSASSIFSREDVIKLINSVEEEGRKISVDDIETAIDKVISNMERSIEDVVDYASAELSLSCDNRIELENIELNVQNIREILENNFMDFGETSQE